VDTALVGVLIGGALTIIGQVVVEALRTRKEKRQEAQLIRAAARVQRIEFWSGQTAILDALERSSWWAPTKDPMLQASSDDRRLLAQHLTGQDWQQVSTAWRKFQERLNERDQFDPKTANNQPLYKDDTERLLVTFISLDEGRAALSTLSELPQEYRPLPPSVSPDLVGRVLAGHEWISAEGRRKWAGQS
jgi:hypothetical protein